VSRESVVLVTDPEGKTDGVVCRDLRECLTVVLEVSKTARPLTIMSVIDGKTRKPKDRWGISKDGELVHSPYCK